MVSLSEETVQNIFTLLERIATDADAIKEAQPKIAQALAAESVVLTTLTHEVADMTTAINNMAAQLVALVKILTPMPVTGITPVPGKPTTH